MLLREELGRVLLYVVWCDQAKLMMNKSFLNLSLLVPVCDCGSLVWLPGLSPGSERSFVVEVADQQNNISNVKHHKIQDG